MQDPSSALASHKDRPQYWSLSPTATQDTECLNEQLRFGVFNSRLSGLPGQGQNLTRLKNYTAL